MFAQAVAAMNESLTAQIRLPDPAPSPGHGSAYDKFLAMYNQMRDGMSSPPHPPDTSGIELSA
jgi:hypothetical protein